MESTLSGGTKDVNGIVDSKYEVFFTSEEEKGSVIPSPRFRIPLGVLGAEDRWRITACSPLKNYDNLKG